MSTQPQQQPRGAPSIKKPISPQMAKWIDNPNPNQYIVIEKFSRLNGRVLSLLESAMPEGQQLSALKKLVEDEIYAKRDDLLDFFKDQTGK